MLVNGPAGLLQVARDRVEELERRWSRFRPDSEISRLNALAGSPMAVSPETLGLVGRALEGARVTGGRYDPTVLGDVLRTGYDRSFEEVGAAGTAGGADGLLVDDHGRLHPSGGFARFLAGDGAEPEVSG